MTSTKYFEKRNLTDKPHFEYISDVASQLGAYVLAKFANNNIANNDESFSKTELMDKAKHLVEPSLYALNGLVRKIEDDVGLQLKGMEPRHNVFKIREDNKRTIEGKVYVDRDSVINDARNKIYSMISSAIAKLYSENPNSDVLNSNNNTYSGMIRSYVLEFA